MIDAVITNLCAAWTRKKKTPPPRHVVVSQFIFDNIEHDDTFVVVLENSDMHQYLDFTSTPYLRVLVDIMG